MSKKFLPAKQVKEFLGNIPNGQRFTVTFEKQDGATRRMVCQKGVTKHLTSPEGTPAKKAPDHIITVYDAEAQQYRSFDVGRVRHIKGAGDEVGTKPEGAINAQGCPL